MVVRLMVPGWMQSERDKVPAATPQLGREDVLLCFLHVTSKVPQPPSDDRVMVVVW